MRWKRRWSILPTWGKEAWFERIPRIEAECPRRMNSLEGCATDSVFQYVWPLTLDAQNTAIPSCHIVATCKATTRRLRWQTRESTQDMITKWRRIRIFQGIYSVVYIPVAHAPSTPHPTSLHTSSHVTCSNQVTCLRRHLIQPLDSPPQPLHTSPSYPWFADDPPNSKLGKEPVS